MSDQFNIIISALKRDMVTLGTEEKLAEEIMAPALERCREWVVPTANRIDVLPECLPALRDQAQHWTQRMIAAFSTCHVLEAELHFARNPAKRMLDLSSLMPAGRA
jgi:hypothetical protein